MHRRGLLTAMAASEAGYEGEAPESFTVEQEFDATGVNAQVSATTWVAGYENRNDGSALFVASTPDASIGGRSVNPLVRAGDAGLIRRLLERVNRRGIGGEGTEVRAEDIEERGSETRTVLGRETEVSILETTVDAETGAGAGDGQSGGVEDVPVFVYVATVRHEGDVVALVGVHPTAVDAGGDLLSLMVQVEHPSSG
ncbi:DUF6517 family protein [Halorubrum sp. SD626R]|uniref:DUF6517 family protein n=1 Tax=Halorubrum sp. SD626R TaxID=1419722 RepID=UPI000B0AB317|nr:DUF6517 family protein [Halorubrum sp. SD626R]TKX82437.1 hypothetical protein EXE53_02245 [Halorubrum sp. SD626R]